MRRTHRHERQRDHDPHQQDGDEHAIDVDLTDHAAAFAGGSVAETSSGCGGGPIGRGIGEQAATDAHQLEQQFTASRAGYLDSGIQRAVDVVQQFGGGPLHPACRGLGREMPRGAGQDVVHRGAHAQRQRITVTLQVDHVDADAQVRQHVHGGQIVAGPDRCQARNQQPEPVQQQC